MNIEKPLISVIMPVYNSEKYLSNTCYSIINQTYTNFELILVDDGSNDNSPQICDSISKKDSRVVVVHQNNKGICGARNSGLKIARGKYIAFCDNDDEMICTCLEKCIEVAEKTNAECVRFRRRHELQSRFGTVNADYPFFETKFIEITKWSDYLESIQLCGYGIWAGIYNRNFLEQNQIQFDETIRYGFEDHIFVAQCIGNSKKISFVPEVLYVWKQRESNSTSCKSGLEVVKNRILGIISWFKQETNIMKRLRATNEEISLRKYSYICCALDEMEACGCAENEMKIMLKELKKDIDFSVLNFKSFKSLKRTEVLKNQAINRESFKQYKTVRFLEKVLRVLRLK